MVRKRKDNDYCTSSHNCDEMAWYIRADRIKKEKAGYMVILRGEFYREEVRFLYCLFCGRKFIKVKKKEEG